MFIFVLIQYINIYKDKYKQYILSIKLIIELLNYYFIIKLITENIGERKHLKQNMSVCD